MICRSCRCQHIYSLLFSNGLCVSEDVLSGDPSCLIGLFGVFGFGVGGIIFIYHFIFESVFLICYN